MVQPPYGIIWNRLKEGKVIPFLGAGASIDIKKAGKSWDPDNPLFLPSGKLLARTLAKESSFPSNDDRDREDLAKVSSYYSECAGRDILCNRLRKIINNNFNYGKIHELLSKIPTTLLFVVTNYDTLLEQAFQAAQRPYDLVIYMGYRKDFANAMLWWPHGEIQPRIIAPNELDIDLDKTDVIFKMHGTIIPGSENWDEFVITEEDYIEFLSRMTTNTAIPALFIRHFYKRQFLFLGYSLNDWNLRVILKNLSKCFTSRTRMNSETEGEVLPSWSIQMKPSELEIELWHKRNVKIYDIQIDNFVDELKKLT